MSTTTTTTTTSSSGFTGLTPAGDVELWVDQRGTGPDVLLIAGLSDPAEAWTFQLDGLSDRYRLTAFDNRGAGRSPMIPDDFSVAGMADDAAALVRSLGLGPVHVAGFSGGSATAQELALRHPDVVRSLVLVSTWARADAYFLRMADVWIVVGRSGTERAGDAGGSARIVAERIPGAEFLVLPGEAHQPFQERPDEFNELVHGFWSRVDGAGA